MRQAVSQSEAARIRKVSRQSINQQFQKGRFTPVSVEDDPEPNEKIYVDEVLYMTKGKRGRPLKPVETSLETSEQTEQHVIWNYQPPKSFGYTIPIPATIVRATGKRTRIKFRDTDGEYHEVSVSPDQLTIMSGLLPSELFFEKIEENKYAEEDNSIYKKLNDTAVLYKIV